MFVLSALQLLPEQQRAQRVRDRALRLSNSSVSAAPSRPAAAPATLGNHSEPFRISNLSTLRVTFVSRRPYMDFVEHSFMGRQMANEDEVLTAARKIPGCVALTFQLATCAPLPQFPHGAQSARRSSRFCSSRISRATGHVGTHGYLGRHARRSTHGAAIFASTRGAVRALVERQSLAVL